MKSDISENRFLGSISASSIRSLLPRSVSTKHKMNSNPTKPSSNSENIPPVDPNVQARNFYTSLSIPKQLSSKLSNQVTKSEPQLQVAAPPDPPVKVVVRIRPANFNERGEDQTVQNVSDNSLTVEDRKFKFDSVLNSNSEQEDVFDLIGVPLVNSALAGYNTSILAYGQPGSGKTCTMWGPPSAMLEGNSSLQGVVPRIFQMLFSEIQTEKGCTELKLTNYQCRCSFLEIYNEEIRDLLDPTQRDLQIKDDPKNGFYVENLTKEYVTNYEDVTQILIKGLSSKKVGATSINSKSSRSHVVFTCIIESWSKSFIVEVDVSTSKLAKIVMNIIKSTEGVSNCWINENGRVEVSGTADPGLPMKKFAKAGTSAHAHFLKFGKCSSNLFLPPGFNANYHYGAAADHRHNNNNNTVNRHFGYGRGNRHRGSSNYCGPPTSYNNINGANRHIHYDIARPHFGPPPHGGYHHHHSRRVMVDQSVAPPPAKCDEGGGITIYCCSVM